jgi:hypothetical protein
MTHQSSRPQQTRAAHLITIRAATSDRGRDLWEAWPYCDGQMSRGDWVTTSPDETTCIGCRAVWQRYLEQARAQSPEKRS